MLDFAGPAAPLLKGVILTGAAVLWVVLLVRIGGLRSLSKMTGFDFVTTIAVGSLVANAGTSTSWAQFAQSLAAMAAIFAVQVVLAFWRHRSAFGQRLLGNQPVLLMENGRFLEEALARTRVTREDIKAKMRQENITDRGAIRAVVLERTGDISILHGGSVDESLLDDIERVKR